MTEEEYLQTQTQIIALGSCCRMMNLKEFIMEAEKADTVGVLLDPTLWREAHRNLMVIKGLAQKLLPFWDEVNKLEMAKFDD